MPDTRPGVNMPVSFMSIHSSLLLSPTLSFNHLVTLSSEISPTSLFIECKTEKLVLPGLIRPVSTAPNGPFPVTLNMHVFPW